MEEEERARITNEIIDIVLYRIKMAIGRHKIPVTNKEVVDLYNYNAEILGEDLMELDDMT